MSSLMDLISLLLMQPLVQVKQAEADGGRAGINSVIHFIFLSFAPVGAHLTLAKNYCACWVIQRIEQR